MRYQVDQTIFAVSFGYESKQKENQINMFRMPLAYYSEEIPNSINIVKLTVTEHHRVPGDWSDELQYDGYLLKDQNGDVFANQYPRASYGQITDTNNYLFNRHFEKDDLTPVDRLRGANGLYYEYYTLTGVLERFAKGIEDLNAGNEADRLKASKLARIQVDTMSKFMTEYPDYQLMLGMEALFEGSVNKYHRAKIVLKE